MAKKETLHTKIAGEHASVKVAFVNIEDTHISMTVQSRVDALIACYCYQGMKSKIEKTTTDNQYLVVIYKS